MVAVIWVTMRIKKRGGGEGGSDNSGGGLRWGKEEEKMSAAETITTTTVVFVNGNSASIEASSASSTPEGIIRSPLQVPYLFMRTKKKDAGVEEGEVPNVPPTPGPTTAAAVVPIGEKTSFPTPIIESVMLRDPIPENQQRELFKWLLEEKRKVKPKDSEEKKRIDEEKAIIKQFIRAKSIPSL
ncbi:hypothetical protein HYC85_028113 [Camellia sinensis]|uniref:Uncharacterized protein n=1 Tax=Camellia sinensis TaxID=4442 RepID=A0A7J7FUD5_CAMSI|nr:hypothetical protein HYC85_028113 [Camellia sinensis]